MNDAILIDVGQGQCRLSLMQRSRGERPRFAHNFEFDNSQFGGVGDVLEHYRKLLGLEKLPPMLGVSFGGPVRGRTSFFNGTWTLSLTDLKRQFGFDKAFVINDVAALAAALPWLGAKDLSRFGEREGQVAPVIGDGRYAVIYANHGLCAAALIHTRHGYEVVDTEAGHTAFAPSTPLEVEILRHLRKTHGRVSNERLICDPGLVNIHRAVCEIHDLPHSEMTPLEILLYSRTNTDAACTKTLDVFFSALGAFAGDVALSLCAEGGIYFFSNALVDAGTDAFRARLRETFEEKGQFRNFVSAIPTVAITNPSARLVGLSWFASDILKGEEEKKVSAPGVVQAFSGAMHAVDQTVIILDSQGKVVSVSGSVWDDPTLKDELLATGADFGEGLKKMSTLGLLGLSEDQDIEILLDKLKRGEEFTVEHRLFGGRVSEMRARPLADGYAIIDRDITELRKRTSDLETLARDLRAATGTAEAASRAKSQFLANMSHEIRTPLNGVLGMADILGRTRLSPEQKDMLDTVISSGNSLLGVINDVLDFSKIEAGKMRLINQPFNLRTCIEDAVAALAPPAEAKGLELIVRLDPALCDAVIGDEGRVRQILTNILGNAIKFTDKGHVLVDVGAERRGSEVVAAMSVSDTGCGIPKEKLERVFEMFEQVDGSASRHHDGTGLGLAITRRLLGLMQGQVRVESEFGQGTTFSMTFSLGHDAYADTGRAVSNVDISGRAILVVDDNEVNRRILEEQTRSWGLVPTSVAGGAQALAMLESGTAFAMAILDYQMPGMNGFELATQLKSNPATKALPLLLLTSVGQLGDLDEKISAHFAAMIVKPARSGQLADKVREIISHTSAAPAVIRPAHAAAAKPVSAPASKPVAPEPVRETQPVKPSAMQPEVDAHVAVRDKITILVAEDNEVNRRVIGAMLADGGYEIHFAHDGVQAVESYRKLQPDIVLMDVSMPHLDGLQATSKIRQLEIGAKRTARVIGLTAHAMPDDRKICLDSGMDDYLAKPVNREKLLSILKSSAA
jgi:glucokinase